MIVFVVPRVAAIDAIVPCVTLVVGEKRIVGEFGNAGSDAGGGGGGGGGSLSAGGEGVYKSRSGTVTPPDDTSDSSEGMSDGRRSNGSDILRLGLR